jgi:hypothetical protein
VALSIQPANVLTFEVNLPIGRYQDPLRRAELHRDLEARLEALPGRARGCCGVAPAGDRRISHLAHAPPGPAAGLARRCRINA